MNIAGIQKLRFTTGAGMMSAKKALEEAEGSFDKAVEILRKKGEASAAKRADRETREGVVASYVHGGKIGVLVEVNCETDFVARTDDFKSFARDVAMHVAASDPIYLTPEAVPTEVVTKEREIYMSELEGGSKPAEIKEKIIDGKLNKYFMSVCLLKQPFVKDPDKSIEQLQTETAARLGEKVTIARFSRLELGRTD